MSTVSPLPTPPRIRPPAGPSDLDRLIAAVGAQTDCLSAVLDKVRDVQREVVLIRRRASVCALAALPAAIAVLLALVVLLLMALSAVATAASAADGPAVLEVRDGHHYRILDPASGSVWITPRFSNGLTARQAVKAFPGFRLATRDQVLEMFAHAGLPQLADGAAVLVDEQAVKAFQQLMDDTVNVVGTYSSGGRTIGQLGIRSGALVDVREVGTLDTPITFEGHWLVRVGKKVKRVQPETESWLKYSGI